MRPRRPLAERFWVHVDKRGPDECWPWLASTTAGGYGQIGSGEPGEMLYAHRLCWEIHNSPIPTGLFVCHRCDNRWCVNPAHLFLGTNADNVADMIAKRRQAKGEKKSNAKLTADIVRAIRASPERQKVLAERFGIAQGHVSLIRSGKIWSHIP